MAEVRTEVFAHEEWGAADSAAYSAKDGVIITPEYVNTFAAPTEGFLCPLEANIYGIEFNHFKVRSLDPGAEQELFEVGDPNPVPDDTPATDEDRNIHYNFGPEFLNFNTIGTTLTFRIGDRPVRNFRMIERHYFRGQLLQSYDFEMPFVIPNTNNTWEMIYSKPWLNDEWKAALINAPLETKSDSFYFVENQLVMHNKSEYSFSPADN